MPHLKDSSASSALFHFNIPYTARSLFRKCVKDFGMIAILKCSTLPLYKSSIQGTFINNLERLVIVLHMNVAGGILE